MNTKSSTASKTIKKVWARARTLADMAGHTSPNDARSFLTTQRESAGLLDDPDKRNPNVRKLIQDFQTWLKNGNTAKPTGTAVTPIQRRLRSGQLATKRASLGDKTRPPRAGAPNTTQARKDLPAEILFDLRHLQKKYDTTIQDLVWCCHKLGGLVDEIVNFDEIIKNIQANR